jgi:hypothetical protein
MKVDYKTIELIILSLVTIIGLILTIDNIIYYSTL